MKSFTLILSAIFTLVVSTTFGQIKSLYTPFEYSTETNKNISISQYQLDSLKYQVLYYQDMLEDTKRTSAIAIYKNKVDTVIAEADSMVINYYSKDGTLILKKVYEYKNKEKSTCFLSESYFLHEGKISYKSRTLITDNFIIEDEKDKSEKLGPFRLLQTRIRYVYDEENNISRIVVEIRIGGSGLRLFRYVNDKKKSAADYQSWPKSKISIWEFWD